MKKNLIIINLYGAPGAGKSTGAAYVFSQLKLAGVNAELVTEFAKDKVWEDAHAVFENQLYMFAKQYFRMTRCENKVDVIVTDSPLLLSLIYNSDPERLGNEFSSLVKKLSLYYNNVNYFINRVKKYNHIGRFQTENESDVLGNDIKEMLRNTETEFSEIDGNIEGYDKIVRNVLSMLKYH